MTEKGILQEIATVREQAAMLHSAEAVRAALDRMASAITERLAARNPVFLCVMTGGVMTTTWLAERLDFPLQLDYIHVSRFDGNIIGRDEGDWIARPRLPLAGRHVLLIDDIYDEGITMRRLVEYCRSEGAAEVLSAVLVQKQHDRDRGGVPPDFIGLQVDDFYVFGCGLDYRNYLRNLPAIYAAPRQKGQR